MSKKRGTIEDVLNKLNGIFKSEESEKFEEEEIEKSEDEFEEEVEDEEIEKSEDEFEDEYEDEEYADEAYEDEAYEGEEYEEEEEYEDGLEVDYEELVDRISASIMEQVEDRLAEFESLVAGGMEAQTDAIASTYEKSMKERNDLRKSLDIQFRKLERMAKSKKSIDSIHSIEKFEFGETKPSVDNLTKSQKAAILTAEIEAGNRNITVTDVSRAELGGTLSEAAIRAIEKTLK